MLDLTKRLNGSANPSGSGSASGGIPLTSADKMIVAHGIIAAIGFIFFLPIGALVPRYARTFIAGPTWFKTHWIVQFVFGQYLPRSVFCSSMTQWNLHTCFPSFNTQLELSLLLGALSVLHRFLTEVFPT